MSKISKVLIANRGEIAVRIIRTCKDLGIKTVAVYSRPDSSAPHTLLADESVYIGEAASSQSYLVADKIIAAAKSSGADAIHPGYGFLSENAAFSKRCSDEGIIFIGPSATSIEMMGDKTSARKLMEIAGVPLPPGTTTALKSVEEAVETADKIGYPVLIKAAAGGGGKGMRIVNHQMDIKNAVSSAQSEALNAFGDERVYVEKYLEEPRHIEFQVLADQHGNVVHLYDRECSIQRRHQKVIEEAPASVLTDEMRLQMGEAAVKATLSCGYYGAGTIEFLIDKHLNYYFLEMNTRLQVEHPVTEMITGLDLVEWQIRVAQGEKLPFKQEDIRISGHAMECRICAEDPSESFLPSTGLLKRHDVPSGPGVRVDAGVRAGQEITINYDPLMAKLVTFGSNRASAIDRMIRALKEYKISGVRTTIPFCKFVMENDLFRKGTFDTHFIKDYFTPDMLGKDVDASDVRQISAILLHEAQNNNNGNGAHTLESTTTNWWQNRRH